LDGLSVLGGFNAALPVPTVDREISNIGCDDKKVDQACVDFTIGVNVLSGHTKPQCKL
jgi:hypothetical protein